MHPIHQSWTDHNPSDPGMTILEQLDYALQDLAYRAGFPIPDLLADGGGDPGAYLFSPRQILTTHPILTRDYERLLLDLPRVKYAWVRPLKDLEAPQPDITYAWARNPLGWLLQFPFDGPPLSGNQRGENLPAGLYDVYILPEETDLPEAGKKKLQTDIARLLHKNRNLGEAFPFNRIEILEYETVKVEAKVETETGRNAEQILAEIYFLLSRFVNPDLLFSSLSDELNRQRSPEEIFDGPRMASGFLQADAHPAANAANQLRSSDLIRLIMETPGVKEVLRFKINGQGWILNMPAGKAPLLQTPEDPAWDGSGVVLTKGGAQIAGIDVTKVKSHYQKLKSQHRRESPARLDIDAPAGRDRGLAHYHSIQNHFPRVYGLGPGGLPKEVNLTDEHFAKRLASVNQLKGYLLFFDQILAQNFAQLAQVRSLFSFATEVPDTDSDDDDTSYDYYAHYDCDAGYEGESTYGSQSAVSEEDDLNLLPLLNRSLAEYEKKLKELSESIEERLLRKHQFLDHLLARMGEDFAELSALYARKEKDLETRLGCLLQHKIHFLAAYPELSYYRARSNVITVAVPDTVPGFNDYIRFKLGGNLLVDIQFFIIEHILLRPHPTEFSADTPFTVIAQNRDPFSLQATVVIQKDIPQGIGEEVWTSFVEQTFQMHKPALLHLQIRWETDRYTSLNREFVKMMRYGTLTGGSEPPSDFVGARSTLAQELQIWRKVS